MRREMPQWKKERIAKFNRGEVKFKNPNAPASKRQLQALERCQKRTNKRRKQQVNAYVYDLPLSFQECHELLQEYWNGGRGCQIGVLRKLAAMQDEVKCGPLAYYRTHTDWLEEEIDTLFDRAINHCELAYLWGTYCGAVEPDGVPF